MDLFDRFLVRKLARAQAILGDIDGALETVAAMQETGGKGQATRFELLGDVAEIVAESSDLKKAVSIVEGAPPEVKIRVLLAFTVAHAKRKAPSVEEAFRTAHVLSGKFKGRAKVNILRRIAVAESKAGYSKSASTTCMQAREVAGLFDSPRERAWTLINIAGTMVATGHKDDAARLADETLLVIAKVRDLQAEKFKVRAMSDVASVLGQCRKFKKARDLLENLPGKKETSYGEKSDALVSLAVSANEAGKYSERAQFLKGIDSQQKRDKALLSMGKMYASGGDPSKALAISAAIASKEIYDEVVTAVVEMYISKGKHADALKSAESFKTDVSWGESMLRIALGVARSGDKKEAKAIAGRIRGSLPENRAVEWFNLDMPSTWTDSSQFHAKRGMKVPIAVAAIPVWYELETDGKLTKSPVESIDSEVLTNHWEILKSLAKADAAAGDPGAVMRWTSPFRDKLSPGESKRVSLVVTIATEAARRFKESLSDRGKKTPEAPKSR